MSKVAKNEKGFSTVEVVLVIVIVVLIAAVGWLVYRDHRKNQTTATTSQVSGNSGCSNVSSNTSSQVNSFVDAYKKGSSSTLKVLIECGTPSQGGYVTSYSLATNHSMISSSQYSYGDASPGGPTTHTTCNLVVSSKTNAITNCDGNKFSLFND